MANDRFHGYVPLQARGVVTLPIDLRRRLHLDEPGAQLELTEREDGVVELRVALPVPATEKWFWEPSWQEGERAVIDHLAAGRVRTFASDAEFIDRLERE